jgi:phenylacetate-CoA ligase
MQDTEHFDELETRDPEEREAELFAKLPGQIENARRRAPALAKLLGEIPSAEINSRAALAKLPVLRKSERGGLQKESPPFGGFATVSPGQAAHVFASPGPIYELEGRQPDFADLVAPFATGLRRGDLLYNTFSYHFTPAGLMVDAGARAVGCAVFPAGTGQTELQAATIADLRPRGTPARRPSSRSSWRRRELGADHSSLRKASSPARPSRRPFGRTSTGGAFPSSSATRRRNSA